MKNGSEGLQNRTKKIEKNISSESDGEGALVVPQFIVTKQV